MKKPIRAVGIVIKGEQILLLMWRKSGTKEYWTFPGGGVEGNETIEECVMRELHEETSIKIRIKKLLYRQTYLQDDGTFMSEQFFYLCGYVS